MKYSKILIPMALMVALSILITRQSLTYAEVYKYVDTNGQVHFSDKPLGGLSLDSILVVGDSKKSEKLEAKSQSLSKQVNDPAALESIATELKANRVQREKKRIRRAKIKSKRWKAQKKAAKDKKQKKKACQIARKQEESAFRNRTKKKNLKQMEGALVQYEKKRNLRKQKCP